MGHVPVLKTLTYLLQLSPPQSLKGLVWFDLVWFGLLVGFFWLVGWLILVLFDLVGWLVGSVCFVDFFGLNGLLVC
jgi:hypothetical protein